MFNAFTEREKAFNDWVMDGFPDVKEEKREFIENLQRRDKKRTLWKNQKAGILRAIYTYEILKMKDLLLNIVTGGGKLVTICHGLKLPAKDEKLRYTNPEKAPVVFEGAE